MDADSLYEESQGKRLGLSHRSLVLAIRYGLADWQHGVDTGKMLSAIESGEVWRMPRVGKKTVQEWCRFMAQTPDQPLLQAGAHRSAEERTDGLVPRPPMADSSAN